MAMTRGQFQRELFPGIRELIFRGFNEFPEQYSQIFNVQGSSSAMEEDTSIAGVGLFVRTPEQVEAAEDQFYPGYSKRYVHEDYTLSIGASHQVRRDDKSGFWRERAPDLGFSARQTKEILHADVFNSNTTGPDGVALFASNHPNIRGGTQSNILSPAGTLSVLSLRLCLTAFRKFYDDTGVRKRMLKPTRLVVPPDEEYNAKEILQSAGRPDTANRADNVIKGALTEFVYDYLTDTNNFYILADKSQHKLKSFNREAFDVREFFDDKTRMNWVQAAMAFSYGFSHWIGTYASLPA